MNPIGGSVEQTQNHLQPFPLRILYTLIIFLGHLSAGMIGGVTSPALVDLRYLQGNVNAKEPASMSAISLQSTFHVIGTCMGAFISFLYNWRPLARFLNRQLVTSILLIATASTFAYTPQIHSIYLNYAVNLIGGIGMGNMMAIAVTWLCEMWTGRLIAASLQALQLSYGIGTILGPLIVRPHLFGYMDAADVAVMNVTEYAEKIAYRRNNLTMPFIAVGCFLGIAGLLHFILYFTFCLRYRQPLQNVISEQPSDDFKIQETTPTNTKLFEQPHNRTSLRLFFTLLIVIFAGNNMGEVTFLNFQDAYLQSLPEVNITASEAAVISSITATSYTAGRGASILVSMILSAGNILLLHYGLAVVGISGLLISTAISSTLIKVNVALIGYALSAIMPALFAYINSYAVINDSRNAMFTIALSMPNVFAPLLIGHYLEKVPGVLVYLVLSVLLLSTTTFTIVRFVFVRRVEKGETERNRFKTVENGEIIKSDI